MKRNNFSQLLENYGVPILLVDDWSELENQNELTLNKFYKKNIKALEINNITYFSFWENKFNQYLDE